MAFWRAVAGMAVAAALAAMIVLAEFSGLLSHRTSHYYRRVKALNETVKELRNRISSAERRNANVVERQSADEVLKRVVSAHDLRTIRLNDTLNAAKAADANAPSGTLAMSESEKAAVLQVAGLTPPTQGIVYRVWWQQKRSPDSLAAEFIPGSDGRATVPMPMPPRDASDLIVTSEPGTDIIRPTGPQILKGHIKSR